MNNFTPHHSPSFDIPIGEETFTAFIDFASAYVDGNRAVLLRDTNTGEVLAKLSTNLSNLSFLLQPEQFFLKTWSENEPLLDYIFPHIEVIEHITLNPQYSTTVIIAQPRKQEKSHD